MTGAFSEQHQADDDQILARLAIKNRFLDQSQILEALAFQQRERNLGRRPSLGDILIQNQMISRKQLEVLRLAAHFLKMRQPDIDFCRDAVKRGLISQHHADQALSTQAEVFKERKLYKPIAEILIESGAMKAQQQTAPAAASGTSVHEGMTDAPAPEWKGSSEKLDEPKDHSIGEKTAPADEKGTAIEKSLYELIVSPDRLKACVQLKPGASVASIRVEDVRKLLEKEGITYGLIDDESIERNLSDPENENRPWKIAEGQPPQAGRDAEIRYLFARELQGTGTENEKGRVDFRSRDEIPYVKQGDLLAQKTPAIKEIPGIDVYGRTIPVQKSRDAKLLPGAGVELSPDGLKAYAKDDGKPQSSPVGKLSVLPELTINGDINFETGNILFDGVVNVRGTVQDGFRIKCGRLTAAEISRAQVDVSGDVVVHGGILGANIRCQGNVTALHIHSSNIEAMADVFAEKGIVDSHIVASGKCMVERGHVLSSSIVARQGIEAAQIGSDHSTPCVLTIGIDQISKIEIDRLKHSISSRQKKKIRHERAFRKLNAHIQKMELRIGELAQIQDRGSIDRRSLAERLEQSKRINDSAKIVEVETSIRQLDQRIRLAEEELERLFDRQDLVKEKISAQRDRIKSIEKDILNLDAEFSALLDWANHEAGHPAVKVLGTVFSGTVIKGANSSTAMKADAHGIIAREVFSQELDRSKGALSHWKIKITSL